MNVAIESKKVGVVYCMREGMLCKQVRVHMERAIAGGGYFIQGYCMHESCM
jgi:hypothetical protein